MESTVQKTEDGTIELTISLPWASIQHMYDSVVTETASATEIDGFRKGKAPKQIVEEKIDKTKTYEETIKRLVPKAYSDAVIKHHISPIMMPQIELKSAEEGKDWVVVAKTCERPSITLLDYKKSISDAKAAKKGSQILVPGKKDEPVKELSIDEALDTLLLAIDAKLPNILLEHEVTHQLSQLVDQTKKLGLTVEQYLSSTGKTAESIREEYRTQAAKNLTLEFGLEAIAENEHITVSDEEVEKILTTAKTPEERKELEKQRYYLTSLVRRQKTLDSLMR